MTQIDRSALVFHTSQQMYDVVNDVHLYPDFLPWCASSEVLSHTEQEMVASMQLAKAGLKYSFTTRNKLMSANKIEFELVEGPFKHLFGQWDFSILSKDACKVSLILNFEFTGKFASFAMTKVFSQVANTMVEAFVQRADDLYEK
jgi:ribosome-associated toxin RatA of RatAB toxin-antitoxin module